MEAARLADRLAGLADSLCSDGAAVDHHDILFARQKRANAFALRYIEPAAERYHFRRGHFSAQA
jgi:hypothetical protein